MNCLKVILYLIITVHNILCFVEFTEHSLSFNQTFINKINSTHFSCDNGDVVLPLSSLNDDYCDCNDGSDENKTNACYNGKFFCKNRLYYSKLISSYKLNDGYCDCCDGSDESDNKCNNTCIQQSKVEFSNIENDFITLKQVVNSYKPEENEEYFGYHFKMINELKGIMQLQIKLKKKYHLINSYIRHVELRLNEDNYNNENFIDGNDIKLTELRRIGLKIKEKIDINQKYLVENKYMLISYINYGIFKEFSDDCIETKYNEYICELCLSKFTCRGETKEKKSKTNVFGSFKSFDGNTARFEGGSKCRNYNVNLSAEIKFECGFREEFKLEKKENKCMYKFIYYTMLGCNTYKMNEMFNNINYILNNV